MLQKTWGKRIRKLRGERSQMWLARSVGVDQTTISKIERGVYKIGADLMVGIAAAFEVELDEIFEFPPGLVSRELYDREVKKAVPA